MATWQYLISTGGGEEFYEAPAPFHCVVGHFAYFCPFCGEVWARRLLIGEDVGSPAWATTYASCEKCPQRVAGEIPGSLFSYSNPQSIPDSLLEREFFVHVAYMRRYFNEATFQRFEVRSEQPYHGQLSTPSRRQR